MWGSKGLEEVRMGITVLMLIALWTYPYSFGTVRTKGILTVILFILQLYDLYTWISGGGRGIEADIVCFEIMISRRGL